MGDADLLRELHEAYVWEVNAAVAEGRMDLVWQLADEYTEEAMELMTAQHPLGCGRPDCASCARRRFATSGPTTPARSSSPAQRRRFWRWHRPMA